MNFVKEALINLKRVSLDLIILIVILYIYFQQLYEHLASPLQLLSLKVLLVSAGFTHAHITRKLAFPSIDWDKEQLNAKTILVIVLYAVFIYAYSQGG